MWSDLKRTDAQRPDGSCLAAVWEMDVETVVQVGDGQVEAMEVRILETELAGLLRQWRRSGITLGW